MATIVLDIPIDPLPNMLTDLDAYDQAYVVFRYGDVPVSAQWMNVEDGKIAFTSQLKKIIQISEGAITDELIQREKGVEKCSGKYPSATIAVCTRNRTEDLERCLTSLVSLSDIGQEILVIDNAPQDSQTFDLVHRKFVQISYCLEKEPGLNKARNRALKEALHDIVVFIDDDAVADNLWLKQILKPFARERVACVTGMTQPLELTYPGQEAFERYSPFCKGFRRRIFDTAVNPLATGEIGAGVNMAIRKSIVEKIGWFDELLDAGTPTQSGGDHEYFTRILRSGYYIVYEPRALNWHRHRRTINEAKKAIYGYGVGMYAYWTKLLVEDREWWILRQAIEWFYYYQLKHLVKAILHVRNHHPLALVWAEWRGCFRGPFAYFESRRKHQRHHADKPTIRRHTYA